MDILWTAFEVLVNLYQAFLVVFTIARILSFKSRKSGRLGFAISTLTLFAVLTVFNYITIFEGFASFIYLICVVPYATLCLNGNMVKKILICILPFALVFIITTAVLNFIATLNAMTLPEIVVSKNLIRLIAVMVIQLLFYLTVRLSIKIFSSDTQEHFNIKEWSLVISMLVLSIAMAVFLHHSAIFIESYEARLFINLSIVVLLVMNILVFHMIDHLLKSNRSLREMEVLKTEKKYQEQYVDNAKLQYETIRKIKHDIKNQYLVIHDLIKSGKIDDAKEYIENCSDNLQYSAPLIETDSLIANAVINSKLAMASSMGIQTSCLSVRDLTRIDHIDLCNLLCNMLDNAITACLQLDENMNKSISIDIRKENEFYTFLVTNTIDKSVLESNPTLISTKNNNGEHGIGTKILSDISKKYKGRIDYFEEENLFCCKLSLHAA